MTRLNEKVDTTEGKWREAVRICERILSDRATFDYKETNYKLGISKKVQTLFKALQEGEDFIPFLNGLLHPE